MSQENHTYIDELTPEPQSSDERLTEGASDLQNSEVAVVVDDELLIELEELDANEVVVEEELSDDEAIDRVLGRLRIEGGSRLQEIGLSSSVSTQADNQSAAGEFVAALVEEDALGPRDFDMPVPGIFGTGAEPKEFDRKKASIKLLIFGTVALIAGFLAFYFFSYAQVEIPDLIGMSLPKAVETINSAGLKLDQVSEQASASAPEGTVLDMSLQAGEVTKRGAKISLVVSEAGVSSSVPNLSGLSQEAARSKLLENRLEIEVIPTYSDLVPEGQIAAQLPIQGTQVPFASKVTVLVSQGGFTNSVLAPRVIGLGAEAAQQLLDEQGIRHRIAYASATFGGINEVVAQTPASRGLIDPGALLFMVVSRATQAQDTPVPEVVGLTQKEAETAITQAGFRPEFISIPSSNVDDGRVIAQNPPSEDVLLKEGETVSILLSTGTRTTASVPDVAGKSKEQAIDIISRAGFFPVLIGSGLDQDSGAPIIQQYPTKNSDYRIGMTVLLFANYSD